MVQTWLLGAVLRGWGGPWGEQFAPRSFCILKALVSSWLPLTALYVSSGLSFPSTAHNDQREKSDLSQSLVSLWRQASPAATGIEGVWCWAHPLPTGGRQQHWRFEAGRHWARHLASVILSFHSSKMEMYVSKFLPH